MNIKALCILFIQIVNLISCEESGNNKDLSLLPKLETSEPLKLTANEPFDYNSAVLTNEDDNEENDWTTVAEVLDVFNPKYLARNWEEGKFGIARQCEKDITRYIQGLRKHEFWALKSKRIFFISIVFYYPSFFF